MAKKPDPAAGAEASVAATEQPSEQPKPRVFRLRDAASPDQDGVHRVAVGSDPRVSLGPGETFVTADPRVAARLARVPELEEVS